MSAELLAQEFAGKTCAQLRELVLSRQFDWMFSDSGGPLHAPVLDHLKLKSIFFPFDAPRLSSPK